MSPLSAKFLKLKRRTISFYTGKRVPKKYQKRYGKVYSKKEAGSIAYAIARKHHWRI